MILNFLEKSVILVDGGDLVSTQISNSEMHAEYTV